jgi:hypothetical protein
MSQGNSVQIKDGDGDRVTQGLGTVWSLILGRPPLRHVCLDIVLKVCILPSKLVEFYKIIVKYFNYFCKFLFRSL